MTEREFIDHLRPRFGGKDYALIPQVRNATGFANRVRTADAIAVSLWPSRGVDVHGFEFKDSRTDWLKELKTPAKAEEIGRYCAHWSLVVSDPKIFSPDELPALLGAIHVGDGASIVLKKAPRRDVESPTWTFVAAILRAASEVVTGESEIQRLIAVAVNKADAGRYKAIKDAEEQERKRSGRELLELQKWVREFEEASGIEIRRGWQGATKIGAAVQFVLDGGLKDVRADMERMAQSCDGIKQTITETLASQGV